MKIFIFGKRLDADDIPFIQTLFDTLEKERIEAIVYQPLLDDWDSQMGKTGKYKTVSNYQDLKAEQVDYTVTLGGDGTILTAITIIKDLQVPILGINLGRLGFLASTEKSLIAESIKMLKNGMYSISERTMLHLDSSIPIFEQEPFALNDFTLHKRDTSSMITIHTYINGEFLNSYWADGLIVSTPTGSSGYSLSCGGPIIFPNSGNFVITPVAPHNLTVRPIVISDQEIISFEIEGRTENFLCTLDSRYEVITTEHQIAIRKSKNVTRVVQLHNTSFLKTIHEKLNWGKDSRN